MGCVAYDRSGHRMAVVEHEWLSTSQVAAYTGFSTRTIKVRGQKWSVPNQAGTQNAILWRTPDIFRAAFELEGDASPVDRLQQARTELAELELAKARGSVVEMESALEVLGRTIAAFKAKLRAIPVAAAPVVASMNEAEVAEYLTERNDEALDELAAGILEFAGDPDSTAAATLNKRVGRPRAAPITRS